VLWLCGPPGVSTTTVGWEIFFQLTQETRGPWPMSFAPLGGLTTRTDEQEDAMNVASGISITRVGTVDTA
jgi:hypothetical protein